MSELDDRSALTQAALANIQRMESEPDRGTPSGVSGNDAPPDTNPPLDRTRGFEATPSEMDAAIGQGARLATAVTNPPAASMGWSDAVTHLPYFLASSLSPEAMTAYANQLAGVASSVISEPYFLAGLQAQSPAPLPVADPAHQNVDWLDPRNDFPALHQSINGHPLIWLDNGATTQKPRAVIDAGSRFYERDNSNIHRGAHSLAARATDAYEHSRATVQHFIGAADPAEVIFTRGTTESINLVANSFGQRFIREGDEILVTELEHHSNIVPWLLLCERTGAVLKVVPVDDRGDIRLDEYERLVTSRTRLVALTEVANTTGTIVPVGPMAVLAHSRGARVLVDGAQAVAHMPCNVRMTGVDFYVFSSHKIYGPTGTGVLYGKREVLESMPPWQGGGGMIDQVEFSGVTYAPLPAKFEAGTPNIAGAVGLAAALDYVSKIGMPRIIAHEQALLEQLYTGLAGIPGLHLLAQPTLRAAAASFTIDGHDPMAVARHLDKDGIAVRAGHHCAQPALKRFGQTAVVRATLGLYNTAADIDAIVQSLWRLTAAR